MAAPSGRNDPALNQQLFEQAHQFEFFQAVRLLQWLAVEQAGSSAARRLPVGYDHLPSREVVRFGVVASHAFPAGSIREIREGDTGEKGTVPFSSERKLGQSPERKLGQSPAQAACPPRMVTAFFGLTGPQGVLPRHYTSLLIERIRAKDNSLRDFLDLFHHRLLSHFFRAWQKYRFPFAYEQETAGSPGRDDDLFTRCLYCLVGMGTGGLRGRMEVDVEALLYYGGHLAHWPRNALGLENVLNDYFELPVAVRQFHGQWLYLSADDQSALPSSRFMSGAFNQLGRDVVIGERVWNVESKFRLVVGPLGYRDFRRLMPCGDMLRPFCEMARFHAGSHFDFDVQLILKAKEVPWCRLGGDGADPARLGWNTWIRGGEFQHDVSDPVFSLEV